MHHPSSFSDLSNFVDRLDARKTLSAKDRSAILELPLKIRSLRRHEFIVREDERPRHCCILISGFAMRHKTAGNGGRQIFSIHLAGEPIDLQNTILGRSDHNIEMLRNGEAAYIPVDDLRRLVSARPLIAQALLHESLVDAAIGQEWMLNLARRDSRSRVSHILCELGVRLEAMGLGSRAEYELPMTQEELADALGLTPIHISRTFRGLIDEHLIERSGRSVRVLDWHMLARVGDFDPGYLHLPQDR